MTPEEDQLRRALEARSGSPSPEFRARLSLALGTRAAPTNLAPAIAFVVAVVLTMTSVGILVATRHLGRSTGATASGARVETPSPAPITGDLQLSAPSSRVVWGLVAGLYLFRSTDQGATWQRRTMPENAAGTAKAHIAFADDHDGWVSFVVDSPDCMNFTASSTRRPVTQAVQIYRTVDGAVTWTLVDSAVDGQVSAVGLPLEQCKAAFDFSDSQHGLVGTTDLFENYVWRTSDGGITWAQTRLPHPSGWVPGDGWPHTIKSFGATALMYGPPYFWQSNDWGATWASLTTGMPTPLVIVTPVRWLVIFPGSTSETLDAGKTWHDFPTDYHTDSTRFIPGDRSDFFVFADDSVGYGTDLGHVIRTLDGGAHWELIKTSWP
jgi:hypothetical protein